MQSEYAQAFDREMGCTQADWLRWLPAAIGEHEWRRETGSATVRIGAGVLTLEWRTGEERVIAMIRLPRLHVRFRFEDVDDERRHAFMKRFDLYMQRGGG
jgi:hypothetical protein